MQNISSILKYAAVAGALGIGAIALGTGTAAARTYTDCDGGSCVRVHCNDFTGDCWRESAYRDYDRDYNYDHDYYNGLYGGYDTDRHWACDEDGDDCRWVPD
ncbi:MAG TPA: hypothetical protein VMU22_10190 [Rhizomicrobium sp.]|nr:hypothetical protein [Rhizomicrobium sp.]